MQRAGKDHTDAAGGSGVFSGALQKRHPVKPGGKRARGDLPDHKRRGREGRMPELCDPSLRDSRDQPESVLPEQAAKRPGRAAYDR